jgi:hypothetical protein
LNVANRGPLSGSRLCQCALAMRRAGWHVDGPGPAGWPGTWTAGDSDLAALGRPVTRRDRDSDSDSPDSDSTATGGSASGPSHRPTGTRRGCTQWQWHWQWHLPHWQCHCHVRWRASARAASSLSRPQGTAIGVSTRRGFRSSGPGPPPADKVTPAQAVERRLLSISMKARERKGGSSVRPGGFLPALAGGPGGPS